MEFLKENFLRTFISLLFIGMITYFLIRPLPSDDATFLNNRAFNLTKQKKYDMALKLYQKALQKERINLTENHPDMAIIYNNMGFLYENKGEYEKALVYHKKAKKLRYDTLGRWDALTIKSVKNINRVEKKLKGKGSR